HQAALLVDAVHPALVGRQRRHGRALRVHAAERYGIADADALGRLRSECGRPDHSDGRGQCQTAQLPLHRFLPHWISYTRRQLDRPRRQNGYGFGLSLIVTHCQLVNSSQLAGPPMRVPLPGNGMCGSSATVWSLIWSRPVRSRLPSASARPTDFENTPAERPYSLLLASSTASSSVANGVIAATGPNTSSSKARMPRLTPESTVGR